MNLLLLEDVKSHASLFKYALEDLGWKDKITINWAQNTEEAEDLLNSGVDIMFVDYLLGHHTHKTGADFCKSARAKHPDSIIIVLSSSEDPQDIDAAYAAGANAFVHKFELFDDALEKLNRIFTYYSEYKAYST